MRWLAVLVLAVPALAQDAAPVQQGVKLEAKDVAVGAPAVQVAIETAIELDITIKDSEPERTDRLSQVKTEQFKQEVVAGEAGAWQWRLTCSKSTVQRAGPNQPLENVATELQGRMFLVKPVNSRPTVTTPDGSALPAGAEDVAGWECFKNLLPAQEVKPGDKWNVEKDVAELLSVTNLDEKEKRETKIESTLEKIEGAIATIGFKGDFSGKTKDGAAIKVNVAGKMEFDKDRGRPVSIIVAGGLETTKDIMQAYVKPGQVTKSLEKVGEVKTKSRKLEVSIKFE